MVCTTAKCIFAAALSMLNPTSDVDKEQAFCMAMNVYHEARAESLAGQIQVAHATMARVNDKRFPGKVCDVIKSKVVKTGAKTCAFSWVCDKPASDINFRTKHGTINEAEVDSFRVAVVISVKVINGDLPDMCDGANYYYNPTLARPKWARYYTKKCVIDDHVFMKREEGSLL